MYIFFDGMSDAVDYQMNQEFLPRDYFRFQTDLGQDPHDESAPNDDMDDARPENIEKLEAVAEELIKREAPALNRLVNQLKKPLTPRKDLV